MARLPIHASQKNKEDSNKMSILNYEEMTLESDTFQAARETFNLMLQKLFKKMEQSDMDEGSIDLKISIELNEDYVPQDDGTTVRIKKPLIKHKISTVVPVKDSADGKRDTGMCLVYDEKLKRYVLKYVSTGGQMNIFDMEQQSENDADIVDSEAPAIEGPTYFLPDNQTDAESEELQEEEQNNETDGIMTVPDNVDGETDTDVPSGGYGSTDDSGMPLPFSEDDDDYPYDEPMEE